MVFSKSFRQLGKGIRQYFWPLSPPYPQHILGQQSLSVSHICLRKIGGSSNTGQDLLVSWKMFAKKSRIILCLAVFIEYYFLWFNFFTVYIAVTTWNCWLNYETKFIYRSNIKFILLRNYCWIFSAYKLKVWKEK